MDAGWMALWQKHGQKPALDARPASRLQRPTRHAQMHGGRVGSKRPLQDADERHLASRDRLPGGHSAPNGNLNGAAGVRMIPLYFMPNHNSVFNMSVSVTRASGPFCDERDG